MGQEQKIQIEETKKGDKTYFNLKLKPNKDKQGGLEVGNFVYLKKIFPEGMEKTSAQFNNSFYIARVEYDGKECSLILNENEHNTFKTAGEAGDRVKATLEKVEVKVKAGDLLVKRLVFEKA